MTFERLDLERFLAGISQVRALVIGDLMLDEYVWGTVGRISPEAPVQIVDVHKRDLRLGGMGNVVNNLASLGCQIVPVAVLGDDSDGALLTQLLCEKTPVTSGIFLHPGRMTSRKTRVLASNQQVIRIDQETRVPISANDEDSIIEYAQKEVSSCNIIFISDYQKGVLTDRVLKKVIDLGKRSGLPVVIDPKGDDFSKYRGATLLTPNRKEAQRAAGLDLSEEKTLLSAGHKIRENLELDALALTRSEEGMTIFTKDSETHMPTMAREVYDVSGAGDTVISLLGLGLALGYDTQDSARIANLGAGVVVGKVGTSTVSPYELLSAYDLQHPDANRKFKSLSVLKSMLDQERSSGKKIVFTNGCFDLLHVGHVKYLQAARNLGDVLVLGLNSDSSISRLKGPKRPLIGEVERAHILSALNCVDFITIFEEDTPEDVVASLRPDILVKGGDYDIADVVGREIVESYGGRVELINFVDGKSTTNIINRILEAYGD